MKHYQKKPEQLEEIFAYLDLFYDDADELPDGAFMAYLQDSVDGYNRANNAHYDPHDIVLRYLEQKSGVQTNG